MKQYIRERDRQERISRAIGVVLAFAVPVSGAALCSFTGLKYIYPPPQETTFLIDFSEESEEVIQHRRGSQPRAEEVDLTRPIELVQKSESPYQTSAKQNLTAEATPDDHGDVEVPAPPKEPEINKNALFPGMAKQDTSLTAPHGASEAKEGFKAGQPAGNTDKGRADGAPNAHLKGRNVVGTLPSPKYNVQNSGVVVVKIWVDNYGTVTKAQAGADGTTVTDQALWAAARAAAMGAHFNQTADAPALAEGTITYVFRLEGK